MDGAVAVAEPRRGDPAVSELFHGLKTSASIEIVNPDVLRVGFKHWPDVESPLGSSSRMTTLPSSPASNSGHPSIESFLTQAGAFSHRPSLA